MHVRYNYFLNKIVELLMPHKVEKEKEFKYFSDIKISLFYTFKTKRKYIDFCYYNENVY